MTHHQTFAFASIAITLGGLGLLAIAIHAAMAGVWSAAIFIGVMGLALLTTVVVGVRSMARNAPREEGSPTKS